MKADLTKAIGILNEGSYTCVLCKENKVYTSTERGVLLIRLQKIIFKYNMTGLLKRL